MFHQHNYAPSRIPTRIHPAPIIAAPSHHSPPTTSWKITIPSNAVIKKLAEVFVIETFVVEGPAVRARVNRAHMMMLQRTLRPRQSYISYRSAYDAPAFSAGNCFVGLTPLIGKGERRQHVRRGPRARGSWRIQGRRGGRWTERMRWCVYPLF